MDTKIEKKQSKFKIILIGVLALAFLGISAFYFLKQKKTYNVKAEDIQISEVTFGKFEDVMLITAQTQSLNSSLVNVFSMYYASGLLSLISNGLFKLGL